MSADKWGFAQWAPSYDDSVSRADLSGDWIFKDYGRVLDTVVAYCGLDENSYSSLLDIGCGTGSLAARFLSRGLQVTGIDPVAEMRRICRRQYPAVRVMAGDFLKIPPSLPRFDLIVSTYALHHLTAPEKAAAVPLLKKHLKPGGRVVIADLMFQNAAAENRIKQALREAGRADILADFAEEFPALYEELGILFQGEGFCFDGARLTDSVWLLRASL
ncbi:MAG: class I SAM-dependent methyltransferase [Dehalococcoidales bacterium]|jgi:putative AdoMet-dependent methyltransferase